MSRQAWLMRAVDILRDDFAKIGEIVPYGISVFATWPDEEISKGTEGGFKAYWDPTEGYSNLRIYVDPKIDTGVYALDILVHELVHAVVGALDRHGKQFHQVAATIGMDDSGITARAEEILLERLCEIKEILGTYPEETV